MSLCITFLNYFAIFRSTALFQHKQTNNSTYIVVYTSYNAIQIRLLFLDDVILREDIIVVKAVKSLQSSADAKAVKQKSKAAKNVSRKGKAAPNSKVSRELKATKETRSPKIVLNTVQSNETPLNHLIGQAIAKYRKQAALSQEQLAEALGIGYEAVSRMERGVVVPSVERLIEIAEVVNCPVTELLTQSSPRPSDEVVHLHQLLSSLSHENKLWLMEQVEQWVAKLK